MFYDFDNGQTSRKTQYSLILDPKYLTDNENKYVTAHVPKTRRPRILNRFKFEFLQRLKYPYNQPKSNLPKPLSAIPPQTVLEIVTTDFPGAIA